MKEKIKKSKLKKDNNSFKIYLKNFLIFFRDNIEKKLGILLVISLLLAAIELKFFVNSQYDVIQEGNIGLFREFFENVKIILITAVAGLVPYIYASVIGYFGYIYAEVSNFAVIMNSYGFLKGVVLGVVPFILNIVVICIVTALGLYICRKITVGYRISSIKNMNFLNFRIRLYEVIGNDNKVKEYTEKRDKKISKLENKKEKLNYLQIVNTLVLCLILQFVSVVIGRILI